MSNQNVNLPNNQSYSEHGIQKIDIKDLLLKHNVIVMLLILIIFSSVLSDSFFTSQNLSNLLRQSIPLLLVSIGMLLVIITGGIDLSVGSVAAVGSMVLSIALTSWGFTSSGGLFLGILIVSIFGLALGSVSGYLVSYSRMAPFVVTLAMMTIARGISYMLTNGQPIRLPLAQSSTGILSNFGSNSIPFIGIPWPILVGLIVVIIFYLIMKYTAFGRLLIATGSNETAVLFAGINTKKYKFFAYAISGLLSAIAGIIVTSRSSVGVPVTGIGLELDAIAACVIGGASLAGGKGTVINTVIGVLILMLIGNIMNLLSVPNYPQQVIKGAIIIGAVFLQSVKSKKATV